MLLAWHLSPCPPPNGGARAALRITSCGPPWRGLPPERERPAAQGAPDPAPKERDPVRRFLTVANYFGQTAISLFNGASLKGFWTYNGDTTLDMGGGSNSAIQNVNRVNSQLLRAFSSSDPRTFDAPLKTDGGAWIEKSLDVRGQSYFNNHINLPNGVNAYCGGDIYLGLGGVNRWLYDGDGNRLLQKRYATTPVTLADVIAVLQHHGLSA